MTRTAQVDGIKDFGKFKYAFISHIKINEKNISFESPIDRKLIFTIWEDEYYLVIEAIEKSKQYKKLAEELRRKYET
jgi:hypothetical protein